MKAKTKSALKWNGLGAEQKVVKAQSIIGSMQSSGFFPATDMPIAYTALTTLVSNLHNAVIAAENGTTVDTANMHEQESILKSAFNLVKAHVEHVANTSGNDPEVVIVSAGLQVFQGAGGVPVTELTLDALGNGSVQMRVPRHAGDAAFRFEYSLTNNGNDWQLFTYSSLTKQVLTSQAPASTLYVRYAIIGKTGMGAFSSAKSVIVL